MLLKWRHRRAYLLSVVLNPICYDVDRQPIGPLVEKHVDYARAVLLGEPWG